jgi:hypothetical protein
MTLERKGARRVVVHGTAYRWRLRRRLTPARVLAWSPCKYAVEHADTPGTTLVVITKRSDQSSGSSSSSDHSMSRSVY